MADKLKLLSKQDQTEFDHRYACWANNHRGWQKCKKRNRKNAKARLKEAHRKELEAFKESQVL